jgi:hypothetical protein
MATRPLRDVVQGKEGLPHKSRRTVKKSKPEWNVSHLKTSANLFAFAHTNTCIVRQTDEPKTNALAPTAYFFKSCVFHFKPIFPKSIHETRSCARRQVKRRELLTAKLICLFLGGGLLLFQVLQHDHNEFRLSKEELVRSLFGRNSAWSYGRVCVSSPRRTLCCIYSPKINEKSSLQYGVYSVPKKSWRTASIVVAWSRGGEWVASKFRTTFGDQNMRQYPVFYYMLFHFTNDPPTVRHRM